MTKTVILIFTFSYEQLIIPRRGDNWIIISEEWKMEARDKLAFFGCSLVKQLILILIAVISSSILILLM